MSLTFHHLVKLLSIQNKDKSIPTIEEYDHFDYTKIFNIQYENLRNNFIWIVNTCILILVNYKPKAFFEQLTQIHLHYQSCFQINQALISQRLILINPL